MPLTATELEQAAEGQAISLPVLQPASAPEYSFRQRVCSGYYALWYELGEWLAWSRGTYQESPVGRFQHLSGIQQARITILQQRFSVRFERHAGQSTALKQYDYLDMLERTWSTCDLPRSVGGVVHDIGSSNFWYASALHAFFRPSELVGIELEGHRLYLNGYSRLDYARGYIQHLPNTRFEIGNYLQYQQQADVITAWYPFVTPKPVLAWRLPLSVLDPQAFFSQVTHNLRHNGLFVMVNQGGEEAAVAARYCRQVGLSLSQSYKLRNPIRPRIPPVVSVWKHSPE